MSDYFDIYDRVGKRCMMLSSRPVINFINGRFHTNYPTDSKITYNWTEHTNENLKQTLADGIITINGSFSYHIEFQMDKDNSIVLRTFEYGFYHAQKNQGTNNVLIFPDALIIYLYEARKVPDVQTLTIRFGSQGEFEYQVPTLKYQELSPEAKMQKDLILLLPFQMLRLRKAIEKERTKENMEALKHLITHDIIETIRVNEAAGNITKKDARTLRMLALNMFHHIYDGYEEMETEGVNKIVNEQWFLDIDLLEQREAEIEVLKKEAAEAKKKETAAKKKEEAAKELENAAKKEAAALKLLLHGASIAEAASATGLTEAHIDYLKNGDS